MASVTRSHAEREQCPLYTAITVISGRWKLMVCRRLTEGGALGFGELRRSLPGVTPRVLRQQLREMEADGLIAAERCPVPLRVTYRLTAHGRTLGPVFETLWSWGRTHLARQRHDVLPRHDERRRSGGQPPPKPSPVP